MENGKQIILQTNKQYENNCDESNLFVDYPNITKVVKPGNKVFIDDGLISLIVKKISN